MIRSDDIQTEVADFNLAIDDGTSQKDAARVQDPDLRLQLDTFSSIRLRSHCEILDVGRLLDDHSMGELSGISGESRRAELNDFPCLTLLLQEAFHRVTRDPPHGPTGSTRQARG